MNKEFFVVGYLGFDGNFNFVQRVVNNAVTHTGDANLALKFETVDLAKDCLNVVEDVADNTNYDVFKYTLVIAKVEEETTPSETPSETPTEG
jgi:hypothetical protein